MIRLENFSNVCSRQDNDRTYLLKQEAGQFAAMAYNLTEVCVLFPCTKPTHSRLWLTVFSLLFVDPPLGKSPAER